MERDGGVFVSKNDQFTYQTIMEFISGKLTRAEAAELIQVRERSISRMARRIETKGILGVTHGNRGKRAPNQISEVFKCQVMDLMEKHYFDCNMTHALELLKQEQGIEVKYATLRRWCHEKQLVKRRKRRNAKARYSRVRMSNEGLLLQFDGSPHHYNRKDEWCLIGAIDDATSDIPYAEFFLSEDTLSCMRVMQKIIENKGIPHAIYVDRAGWFGGAKRQNFSQFKRACEELGIRVIFASSPQAKGRIERAWDTIQDRIVPEMRLRNIHRIPAANDYLQNQFLPNYWKPKNTVVPKSLECRYRSLPVHINLNEIFCIKEYRSVNRNHTLSWDGVIYELRSPLKYSIGGQKIEIRTYQDFTWRAYFAGKVIELNPLQKPERANAFVKTA
jgi:transposase